MTKTVAPARPSSFAEIIDLWQPNNELAPELSDHQLTCPPKKVHLWKHRDSIPEGWWRRLLRAARRRKFDIDAKLLMALAEQRLIDMESQKGDPNG